MQQIYFLLLSVAFCSALADATSCKDGWTAYRDELCIKPFTHMLNYQDAKEFCESQGNDLSKTSLLVVKEPDMQKFLRTFTLDIHDNLWLGSKYDNESASFQWLDGETLNYTNWQEGYPRNETETEACIELRPADAKMTDMNRAKWADVTCHKRNLVVCQRPLVWSLQDAVDEIKRIRKQHQVDLSAVSAELKDTKENLEKVTGLVVPVGSIYIEYNGQPSPPSLWPTLTWTDISDTFAGLFFRVSGGAAASWGSTQSECAPRITQLDFHARPGTRFSYSTHIPSNGWSDRASVGDNSDNGGTHWREGIRMHTQGCEVRPRNQAVRIWKRTA